MILDFREAIEKLQPALLRFDKLLTLQVNLGNRCNQHCAHCHLQAGPDGSRIMSKTVMQRIIDFVIKNPNLTVDITGGCPELNPHFTFFLENISPLAQRVIIRTNLTVFFEPGLERLPDLYREHNVIIVASLPCYTEQNVDSQRGDGVFKKSIKAIKKLNELGYGRTENLELNLVYNPGGEQLPGPQQQLEADYKKQLNEDHGITFNSLFTITNAPIGRFRHYLEANGGLAQYMRLLAENFNPEAATAIMCRNLISVGYRGVLYNCDFNQALQLPIIDLKGRIGTIDSIDEILAADMGIITGSHCFCCTAGAGSSCTGALTE